MEFDQWLQKLAEEADDTVKEHVRAVASNEKAKNYIKSAFMAHDDYTKKTQELAKQRQDLEGSVEKLRTWYASEGPKNQYLNAQLAAKEKELAEVKERAKKLLDAAPQGDDTPPQTVDPEKFVSREEYDKLVNTVKGFDVNALRFNVDMAKVIRKSQKEGFDVEPDAVYQFAAQNKVTLTDAYEALTSEDRAKRQEQEIEARIKKATDEAVKSALTKHSLPDNPGRDTAAPQGALYRDGLKNPQERKAAALSRFLEVTPKI
jgi:hypothetical protein